MKLKYIQYAVYSSTGMKYIFSKKDLKFLKNEKLYLRSFGLRGRGINLTKYITICLFFRAFADGVADCFGRLKKNNRTGLSVQDPESGITNHEPLGGHQLPARSNTTAYLPSTPTGCTNRVQGSEAHAEQASPTHTGSLALQTFIFHITCTTLKGI